MQSLAVWEIALNVDGLDRGIYRLFENKILKVNTVPDHSVIQQVEGFEINQSMVDVPDCPVCGVPSTSGVSA